MQNPSQSKSLNFRHLPVMAHRVLESIKNLPSKLLHGGLMIDATLGGGGHSALLLESYPNLKVIGIDQDPFARAAAAKRLAHFGSRVKILSANFANFTPSEKATVVIADSGRLS